MTTGEQVKQMRIARGFTQDDLATALGVSKSVISRCELDQRQFRVDQLYTLAKLLEIPPYELVSLTPEKQDELEEISDIISVVEDRYYHGDLVGEDYAWVPKAMSFLKNLIDRELAAAVSGVSLNDVPDENNQEPEFKKRRRRTAKVDTLFNQLNDAGQMNVLEYLKIITQVSRFQLCPKELNVYSGLNEEEGAQLKSVIIMLDEARYERFLLVEAHEPEDSDKMRRNTEQIAGLNEKIAQIITGAIKRTNPTQN